MAAEHDGAVHVNFSEEGCSTASLQEIQNYISQRVPFQDYHVSHDDLLGSCRTLLARVFPHWDVHRDVDFVQCKDGITNKLMKCTNRGDGQTVLVRAYGKKSELIINRMAELTNFVTLSRLGLSPPLYARFANGFVYGFVDGRAISVRDMSDPHISALIAQKMAVWHRVHLPGEQRPLLFATLWKWLRGVPQSYTSPHVQEKFAANIEMEHITRELTRLEHLLTTALNSPIVLCHNDLLSGNIIHETDKDQVSFIDFEYGCLNYRGFDIGNHFCEYAGFDCDYSLYPSREQQLTWLRVYWRASRASEPTAEGLDELYLEVNLFALAAHLYWGLWGLVQAHFSDISFDYMSYAILRLKQYEATKDGWLQKCKHLHQS